MKYMCVSELGYHWFGLEFFAWANTDLLSIGPREQTSVKFET